FAHAVGRIEYDGVEQLGPLDRKQQERELLRGERLQRRRREPYRIRYSDDHAFVRRDQTVRAKYGVAQTGRVLLHDIHEIRSAEARAEVLEDVRLACTDDETDLVHAAANHALEQVFADCARTARVIQ